MAGSLNTVFVLLLGALAGLGFLQAAVSVSPAMAGAAVVGLGIVYLLLRKPVVGLYILAAVVPVERFGRLSDDTATVEISIMRMLGMVAFVTVLADYIIRRRKPPLTAPLLCWSLYVFFALASLTYSSDLKGGLQIASGAFGNILFLFTVTCLVMGRTYDESLQRADAAVMCWLVACIAIALYSIYDWHFGSGVGGAIPVDSVDPQAGAQLAEFRWSTVWEDTAERSLSGLSLRRSMGPTSHAAVFGINLLMSLPFFVYGMRRWRHWAVQGLMLLGLAATAYCLLLTNTRSVIVIGGLVGLLSVMFGLVRLRLWMIMAGLAGCGIGLMYVPQDVFNRVLNVSNYNAQNSQAISIRLDYWEAGFRAIMDNWMMGVGVGNRQVMLSYLRHPIEGHSTMHNIYLQTALDVGILGWLSFAAFVLSSLLVTARLRQMLRAANRDDYWLATAALILVITVIAYGFQVDVFFFPLKAWWLLVGIVSALYVQARAAEGARGRVRAPLSRGSVV